MKALVDISKNNWLQKIPTKWEIFRIKSLFQLSQEKNQGEDLPVLSLARSGIRTRDISTNEGQLAESYENYTRIRPNDLVFNPMDLRSGAIDLSTYDGVISLAYSVLRKRSGVDIYLKYFKYYFEWHYLDKIFFPFGQGVSADHRWTLKDDILLNFPVLFPPLETQKQIADYLDEKTKVLDELVAKKEKLIEFLRKKRAALITRAVTKGLNPNVKLKPSGVDWLGDIPEGWGVKKIKEVFRIMRGRVIATTELDPNGTYPVYSSQTDNDGVMGLINTYDYSGELLTWTTDGAKAGTVFKRTGKFNCTNVCGILKPKDETSILDFFVYSVQHSAAENRRPDTNGYKIMSNEMKRIQIIYPPIHQQKIVADYLNKITLQINQTIALIESQIEKLKEYRSSLIYHAVTGKIKV